MKSRAVSTFDRCVRVEETTPIEPGDKSEKVYAPGIGLIKGGVLVLASYKKK